MLKLPRCLFATLIVLPSSFLIAQSPGSTGSIVGGADPGAQIVLTGVDSGSVIGILATCDGTYKAENLKPGRYTIVEGGPHHAVRKFSINPGAISHVDLGAASTDSIRACNAKKQIH
jgi:hypothetical protein